MDQKEAKERIEKYKKTLESTIKMYENTISEMTENGSPANSISLVIEMKRECEEQLKQINDRIEALGGKIDMVVAYNEISEKLMAAFNPFKKNRFVVDFGVDGIQEYFIEKVSYGSGHLSIVFRNSEEFFAPEYFKSNNYFDKICLYLLSPIGVKKTSIEFSKVKVNGVITDMLDYKDDGILTTTVMFIFDDVEYKRL